MKQKGAERVVVGPGTAVATVLGLDVVVGVELPGCIQTDASPKNRRDDNQQMQRDHAPCQKHVQHDSASCPRLDNLSSTRLLLILQLAYLWPAVGQGPTRSGTEPDNLNTPAFASLATFIQLADLPSGPASPLVAVAFAAITGLGMLAGVWTVRRFESWAVRHTAELIAFAAGLLVSGALLHLIGRASELVGADRALAWTLASFFAFYLLEAHFVPHVHARGDAPIDDPHAGGHEHGRAVGFLVVLGLGVHSVVDGISVGAGLSAGALLGTITAMLVVVHKLPVGIAAMSALYHSGVPGPRAALITTALAMVTPIAVIASYVTLRNVSNDMLGILLALAGGSFLYVGAADLLPEGQAKGRVANTLMFLLGTLVMVGIEVIV